MDSRLTILDELKSISPIVADMKPIMPYEVPVGYFESFPAQLMAKLKEKEPDAKQELENLSPLLSKISKQVPYDSPQQYFNDLSDQALAGAKAIEFVNEELENLSPLMSSLKGKNVYEVPVGYFDSLPERLLIELRKQQPAKLVALRPIRKIMRYAVAAILIGVIAISAWLMQRPAVDSAVVKAKVEAGIQKASDEEILNFIQNDDVPLTESLLNSDTDMDESDIKAMLADVSDRELEQFANESIDQNNSISN